MARNMLFRLAVIGLISVLLIVPLMLTHALVEDRQAARDEALLDIARGTGVAQQVTGPLLALTLVLSSGERRVVHVLPDSLVVESSLRIEERRRGMFQARVYRTPLSLTGRFTVPAAFEGIAPEEIVARGPAYVAVGVTDVRGIGAGLAAALAGTPARFESGARLAVVGDGVHAALPAGVSLEAGAPLDFSITLPLQGTGELRVTPVGRESAVRIRSSWPHPAFIGDFLPLTRAVSDAGFDARWQTSFFATNLEQLARDCARRADCRLAGRATPQLGVALIDPVDHYARTQRATRYAVLIIALTFAGFLLCEVLAGIPVHPVQYGLVGLALALFHLLLLSLSEHFGFAAAYALAALASVALLGVYLTAVLRSRLLGAGFAAGLGLLLGLLYGILAAEDYALLLGTLLLFAMLSLFMVLTRKVDWSAPRPSRR